MGDNEAKARKKKFVLCLECLPTATAYYRQTRKYWKYEIKNYKNGNIFSRESLFLLKTSGN
jgi:hypothetical protein